MGFSVGYGRVVRLRQVVLVARDLEAVAGALRQPLGLGAPFHDEGVGHFGLRNAVMALGDTFVEVVSPCATARPPAGTSTASAAMAATWSCSSSTTSPVRAVAPPRPASARSSPSS